MLIYHNYDTSSMAAGSSNFGKTYKSVNKRTPKVISRKTLQAEGQKKKSKALKKKNLQFLEGLGLKVKPN